jgi:DNA-binding response OmpR family regulator
MPDSPSVLIVDDSELIREAARIGLRHGGWEVRLADDGETGLERALADPPDVVLLDLTMPGMSGAEVLAALRASASTRRVRVVLLTASPREGTGLEVDGIVTKPFAPLELDAAVRGALGWSS